MNSENIKLDPISGQAAVIVARQSLDLFVLEEEHFQPDLTSLPQILQEPGTSFVTLTNGGLLRGCIGRTEPTFPLALDVARNAAAASRDFRFTPVTADELANIRLEVTMLTPFQEVSYTDFKDLSAKLRPGIDGVMLSFQGKGALLLPQVWHRLPDTSQFLEAITRKAGINSQELRAQPPSVKVEVFQAHHFAEDGYREPGS